MRKLSLILPLLFAVAACQPTAREIEYGSDACHYCKMTVVDQQHAAQAVTRKGRVYVFDAIECMVQYLGSSGEADHAILLVCDYSHPGTLVDARQAGYLISEAISSPMGAFLSALPDTAAARTLGQARGGTVYDWPALLAHMHAH
ncbi:MAG: hypothetical protein OHK0039_21280 [Bacteroidia bacterium]